MSKGAQVDLDGNEAAPKEHLTKRFPGEGPAKLATPINKPEEYYCTECDHRVTRSPDGGCEYGHTRECSHSVWRANDD